MDNKYLKLSDCVPLKTPWTVMIEPTNKCNFQCSFCPTGDKDLLKKVGRPLGNMSLDLFKKIIDDLTVFPSKLKSLRLFKDGESFLNQNLIDMIKYAKDKNISEEVYIITNGSLIDKNLADQIIESKLDRLRISIEHVNSEEYKNITKTFANYDKIVDNIKYLYELKEKLQSKLFIDVKIIETYLSKNEKEKFCNDFINISDSITYESLMGWSNSNVKDFTLGNKTDVSINGETLLRELNVCPEPFKGLSINFNGKVSVCCVDWSHKTIIGDISKSSFKDIWTGQQLKEFRLTHLQGNRKKIEVCSNCHYLKGVNKLASIDEIANKLIRKLNG